MSPTTSQTGNRLEGIAVRILERDGYQTFRVRRSPIKRADGSWFSPAVDIGGGDIVAWKPGERVRVIQVTAASAVQDRIDAFDAAKWPIEHVRTEIWYDQSVSAGLGVTKSEWAYQQHFRIRWSDDAFALVSERTIWFDETPPPPPGPKQQTFRGLGRAR